MEKVKIKLADPVSGIIWINDGSINEVLTGKRTLTVLKTPFISRSLKEGRILEIAQKEEVAN